MTLTAKAVEAATDGVLFSKVLNKWTARRTTAQRDGLRLRWHGPSRAWLRQAAALRLRVAAAFLAEAERCAAVCDALAAPPTLPPIEREKNPHLQ